MFKRKLQVFVSSTYSDLLPERQAAVSAILKSGHIPAGMELFTAADKSQMRTIEQWIDESDVYMLILGGRYGSIEPITQLSYTELEFDYAVSKGKPTFAVVIKPDALESKVRLLGSDVMEKSNPKALELFRSKVLGNISSFFSDEKDVKLCVYESLSDFAANSELKGWVSGNEIQDPLPLHEEITKLREERSSLSDEISQLKLAIAKNSKPSKRMDEDSEELVEVLKAIELTIPAKVWGGDSIHKISLLKFLLENKDTLVQGVTNRISSSDGEKFMYFNVMPKLQVHDLALNEKIAGVQYRRSVLNKKGLDLVAYIERKKVLSKAAE